MLRFLDEFQPSTREPILDVGGNPELWRDVGYDGRIVYLNLLAPDAWGEPPPGCRYVQGDGRHLPFAAQEFGIVFSNSVIEHVGSIDDQRRFATEVVRVGRRYWVQTPNRSFPVEPHLNFPGGQWLPSSVACRLAAAWPLSFIRHDGLSVDEARRLLEQTRLISEPELRLLFPEACIWRERSFGLTKSIVAYRC